MKIFCSSHVLPITSPPIKNGAVAIDNDQIVAVGTDKEILVRFPDAQVQNIGRAAILPGFVNCHSHLELTSMRGRLDEVEHDFRSWLLRLNSIRENMSLDEIDASAYSGACEGAAAGVTCFGDIGRYGQAGFKALKTAGLRGIVYQETEFSPDNRTADEDFKTLAAKFESMKTDETELVRVGLSPHSPYTVGSRLFELLAQYSILNRIPLTIHAAESASEIELLMHGTGFFCDVYNKFEVEWQSPNCSPIEYLEKLGVLSTQPLLAHCVHTNDDDINRILANGAKVAHCPKSNAKFGHGVAPLEKFLDHGIDVGLGSDSVASNNVCDMLEEGRFAALSARNRTDSTRFITAEEVLATATIGGAKALGLDTEIGSLETGKQADIAIVSLDHVAQQPADDIHATLVFSSNARDCLMTIVAGKVIYTRNANGAASITA